MKVIDLLNKIANGKIKTKTKIKYNGRIYIYDFPNLCGIYEENQPTNSNYNLYEYIMNTSTLNDEIEIIEETKKIEKLETYEISSANHYDNESTLLEKINEIIDYINKESE